MQIVEAGLGSFLILERNGELTFSGYAVNFLLVSSCLFALFYPVFELINLLSFECPFKSITGLPCPGCGYTRSIENLVTGDIFISFMHNPGWIFLTLFMVTMTGIGVKSMINGRQVTLGKKWLIIFIILIGSTWIGKFLLGSAYY